MSKLKKSKSEKFLPKNLPDDILPSKADLDYSQYFADLAELIEKSSESEALTLRLSTCRNVTLTINSLFVDIREVLGHGTSPSRLSLSIECLRRVDYHKLDTVLHEVGAALSSYDKKRGIWQRREELDRNLEATLGKFDDKHAEPRVLRILSNVRTQVGSGDSAEPWNPKWYEISQDECEWAAERLTSLDKSRNIVDAIVRTVRSIVTFWQGTQLTLFDTENQKTPEQRWEAIYDCLSERALCLSVVQADAENGQHVAWCVPGIGGCQLHRQYSSESQAQETLQHLIEHLGQLERDLYSQLSADFRPNVGAPPLPPPYEIDLSDSFSTRHHKSDADQTLSIAKYRNYGLSAPRNITVAMCSSGVPASYYDGQLNRYVGEKQRQEIIKIAEAAIYAAAQKNVSVLALPELFLPAAAADRIADLAMKCGIALISGVEPTTHGNPESLVNEALIVLPETKLCERQNKNRNSPYETVFRYDRLGLNVFAGTELGAFAVLICSDLREFDIVAAVANVPFLIDTLFVCSFNPQTELFESFAIADAVRLYCHVVIANNSSAEHSETASADGSLVCSPMSNPEDRLLRPTSEAELGVSKIGGIVPALKLFEVALEDLRSSKEKPAQKYLNCPHFRRGKPFDR